MECPKHLGRARMLVGSPNMRQVPKSLHPQTSFRIHHLFHLCQEARGPSGLLKQPMTSLVLRRPGFRLFPDPGSCNSGALLSTATPLKGKPRRFRLGNYGCTDARDLGGRTSDLILSQDAIIDEQMTRRVVRRNHYNAKQPQ